MYLDLIAQMDKASCQVTFVPENTQLLLFDEVDELLKLIVGACKKLLE